MPEQGSDDVVVEVASVGGFALSTYKSPADNTQILHIDTTKLTEDQAGPICRIYLNDEVLWENPTFPQT